MTHPDESIPEIPPVVHPEIPQQMRNLEREDVPCLNCGYNLRGLTEDGSCPECGVLIQRSLYGNLLIYSALDYVASLYRGVTIIFIGIIASIVLIIGGICVGILMAIASATTVPPGTGGPAATSTVYPLMNALLTVGSGAIELLILFGWWLFSAPDPAFIGHENGSRARLIIRITIFITATTSVFQAIIEVTSLNTISSGTGAIIGSVFVAGFLATIVKFFAVMLYLRWLAPRLPSIDIDKKAKRYMWLIPLLFILSLCTIYISTLVALVLYLLLLNQVRQRLQAIRSRQTNDLAMG